MARMTFTGLADRIKTEADAYEYLESLRWPTGEPTCPHCRSVGATFVAPADGRSRKTRTGAVSERRVWRCRSCRKQFSVLTGTPFHGTKVSVRVLVFVIFEMCTSKNGVSAREIERKYGLCSRTAWLLMHRIREMMRGKYTDRAPMEGVIVCDETYIGGNPSADELEDPPELQSQARLDPARPGYAQHAGRNESSRNIRARPVRR